MKENLNVALAPKTSVFQLKINPDIKKYVEDLYANCGMTLAEAINAFIQRSIDVQGLPFIIPQSSEKTAREQAISKLMEELEKGDRSCQLEEDLIPEEDIFREFGLSL